MMLLATVSQQAMIESGWPVDTAVYDEYYEHVALLLEGYGADGSTTFTDFSQYGRTLTPAGAVQMDTDVDVAGIPSIKHGAWANALIREYQPEIDIAYNTPDFCWECYFQTPDLANRNDILTRRYDSGQYTWVVHPTSMVINFWNGTSGSTPFSASHSMVANTTYHICVMRIGTTYYGFVDGVLIGSNTYNSNTISQNTTPIYIGRGDSNTSRYNRGNINHLRLTFGHNRYNPAGFTVPTVPFPKGYTNTRVSTPQPTFSNVKLLLGFDGVNGATTATDDSATGHTPTFVGNAQLSDAQSRFGTTALALDGSGDYVTLPNSSEHSVADSSDFCIEGWVYFNTVAGQQSIANKRDDTVPDEWSLYIKDGFLNFDTDDSSGSVRSSQLRAGRAPLVAGQWYHVAVSRDGAALRMFIDGRLQCKSKFYAGITTSSAGIQIGRNGNVSAGLHYMNGFISELRFTKGEPVYTESFIPPVAPFPRS